jgi:transposase
MNGGISMVMIGIDPHKRTHTAVAVDASAEIVASRLVHAKRGQARELLSWADSLGERRTWAIESAGGLGYLLAQQLVAAGEDVVDIPAVLSARVRVLSSGTSNKNDPNDAYAVALAALYGKDVVRVRTEDHATVLRVLSRRHTQLAWSYNKTACRLHALMCDLIPGGIRKEVVVKQASQLLERVEINNPVTAARVEVARDMIADLAQLAAQRKASERRIRDAVAASGTTLTEIFGIGDVLAATLIGHTGDITRFPSDDKFAAYNGTAPVERSSGGGEKIWRVSQRGNRAMNHALHIAAVTQIRHPHSPGRAFYDRKRAEGKSPRRALRALKRRISDNVYRTLVADAARAAKR